MGIVELVKPGTLAIVVRIIVYERADREGEEDVQTRLADVFSLTLGSAELHQGVTAETDHFGDAVTACSAD